MQQSVSDGVGQSLKTIVKGSGLIGAGMLFGSSLGYAYKLMLAWLGPEEFGIFSLCLTVLGVVTTVAFLGMRDGVVRYVGFYRGKGDSGRVKGTLQSVFSIGLSSSIVAGLMLVLLARPLAKMLFHDPSLAGYIRAFGLFVPLYVVHLLAIKGIMAFKQVKYRVYSYNLIWNVAKIGLTTLLLLLGFRLWGVIWGYGLALLVAGVSSVYFLEWKVFSFLRSSQQGVRNHMEILTYSTPLLFSGMAQLVLVWTDTLMLGYFTSLKEVGVYNVALLVSSVIFLGSELLMPLYLPSISEMYGRREEAGLAGLFHSVTKWIVTVSVPIFLLLALFPREVLGLLFPPPYLAASLAVVLLGGGRFIVAFAATSGSMLMMAERTHRILAIASIAAVLNVLLNLVLIPRWGVEGAALATAISLAVQGGLFITSTQRFLDVSALNVTNLRVAAAAVVASLGLVALRSFVPLTGGWFLLSVCGFLLLYGLLLLAFRVVDSSDRIILAAVGRKLGLASLSVVE